MSIRPVPVPYESFNQSIVPSGSWSFDTDVIGRCTAMPLNGSDPDSESGIECSVWYNAFHPALYHPTLEANMSVNLANYGGATGLDFTWTYWPIYFGRNVAKTSIPVHSQVGDARFDDSFPSFPRSSFDPRTAWHNAPKIFHSGSTSVVRGSDPTIGYIALQINLTISTDTVPNTTDVSQAIYCWVKDIGIIVTTPVQSSTSTGPSSGPSSSPIGVVVGATVGSIFFISLIVAALLLFRRRRRRAKGQVADANTFIAPVNHEDPLPREGEGPTQSPWVGANSADSAQPMATPVGMVEPNDRLTTPWTEGIVSTTQSEGLLSKPGRSTDLVAATTSGVGSSGQQSSGSSDLPTEIPPNTGRLLSMQSSSFPAMPDHPPPIYGLEGSVRQDRTRPPSFSSELPRFASTRRAPPPSFSPEPVQVASTSATLPPSFSPELARFASANRDVINESLEARLQAAGYVPTDDPSDLTPEQWRNEHGVNRIELKRLQNLYARNR